MFDFVYKKHINCFKMPGNQQSPASTEEMCEMNESNQMFLWLFD